jgi:aminoglycoside phosphotransferase family enzyme
MQGRKRMCYFCSSEDWGMREQEPGIVEKVAFLSRPEAYPEGPDQVEARQTHMSWVFLTARHAWKMKKPVRNGFVDLTTLEARRRNCEEEVRLNRRLAPDIYLGIVPLSLDEQHRFRLGGTGPAVEWLVQMRRLPSDLMLDRAIEKGSWTEADIRSVALLLARFYNGLEPVRMPGTGYREQLRSDLLHTAEELQRPEYRLPPELIRSLIQTELACIAEDAALFDARAEAGKIVEAHGDLRPEHICLETNPVIVDCLEFSKTLRTLDPVSELAFLALECERLGAPRVGNLVLEVYSAQTGDYPPLRLVEFYRRLHACVRAKIAVWHLRDTDARTPEKWIARAREYLELAGTGRPMPENTGNRNEDGEMIDD